MKRIITIVCILISTSTYADQEFQQQSEVKRKQGVEYKWTYSVSKNGEHKLEYECAKILKDESKVWIETNGELEGCKLHKETSI